MREIPDPDAIERRGHNAWPQDMGGWRWQLMVFDDDPEATAPSGFEPRELPELGHAVAATQNPAVLHGPP